MKYSEKVGLSDVMKLNFKVLAIRPFLSDLGPSIYKGNLHSLFLLLIYRKVS